MGSKVIPGQGSPVHPLICDRVFMSHGTPPWSSVTVIVLVLVSIPEPSHGASQFIQSVQSLYSQSTIMEKTMVCQVSVRKDQKEKMFLIRLIILKILKYKKNIWYILIEIEMRYKVNHYKEHQIH